MNTIDYTQVPQTFSLCMHDTCPLAAQCLRHMAWAALPDSEERISRNLFKLAVDLSILAKIVLNEDGGGYDEDYLAEMRRDSIREVSETNGAIRMEHRFK